MACAGRKLARFRNPKTVKQCLDSVVEVATVCDYVSRVFRAQEEDVEIRDEG
jgi:hypothetical protein